MLPFLAISHAAHRIWFDKLLATKKKTKLNTLHQRHCAKRNRCDCRRLLRLSISLYVVVSCALTVIGERSFSIRYTLHKIVRNSSHIHTLPKSATDVCRTTYSSLALAMWHMPFRCGCIINNRSAINHVSKAQRPSGAVGLERKSPVPRIACGFQ